MEEILIKTLGPLLISAVPLLVPVVVHWAKDQATKYISPKLIPVVLTIGGAATAAAAKELGYDLGPADLQSMGTTEAVWSGAIVGLASTGVHQAWARFGEWLQERKAPQPPAAPKE